MINFTFFTFVFFCVFHVTVILLLILNKLRLILKLYSSCNL